MRVVTAAKIDELNDMGEYYIRICNTVVCNVRSTSFPSYYRYLVVQCIFVFHYPQIEATVSS